MPNAHKSEYQNNSGNLDVFGFPVEDLNVWRAIILSVEYFADRNEAQESSIVYLNYIREMYQPLLNDRVSSELNEWLGILEQADFQIRNIGAIYCLLNGDDLSYIYHTIDKSTNAPNLLS